MINQLAAKSDEELVRDMEHLRAQIGSPLLPDNARFMSKELMLMVQSELVLRMAKRMLADAAAETPTEPTESVN